MVLLSLVRSNEYLRIGFLENRNRLVVALSRSRRGLYIFGNAVTLHASEFSQDTKVWEPVITYMTRQGHLDPDRGLPVTCTNHGIATEIRTAEEWDKLAGGCKMKCGGKFPCGHPCPYTCHPRRHEELRCPAPCLKQIISCGHRCSKLCSEVCTCKPCIIKNSEQEKSSRQRDTSSQGSYRSRGSSPQKGARYNPSAPSSVSNGSPLKLGSSSGPSPPAFDLAVSAEDWNAWNAAEADKSIALMHKITGEMSAMPVINEIHHAIEIHNDARVRKSAMPSRRLIQSVKSLSIDPSITDQEENRGTDFQSEPGEDLISFE